MQLQEVMVQRIMMTEVIIPTVTTVTTETVQEEILIEIFRIGYYGTLIMQQTSGLTRYTTTV